MPVTSFLPTFRPGFVRATGTCFRHRIATARWCGHPSGTSRHPKILGNGFTVKDRHEQQEDVFRIMEVEKPFTAYLFLTFILLVASFNIIGSISMLIIDKKEDVRTLRNLGAKDNQIIRIFLFEGRMISGFGALIGIIVGITLCYLQQTYGLITLGNSSGSFVVDAYPVSVHPWDVVIVFFTVLLVSYGALWYPVRYLSKRLLD